MSKADKFREMPADFVKLFNRYIEEVLHEPAAPIEQKAREIYAGYYESTPGIGGGDNPMADNLYQFIASVSYFEASDNRINIDSLDIIVEWKMESMKAMGKFINFNGKLGPWLMNLFFKSICRKTEKKNQHGEWGNTWKLLYNPESHEEGAGYTLIGCPLLAFARKNGYEDIMPKFCAIDHASAKMMHAKLIRQSTEALGGDYCDYWFVGDQSETAKKYADLPEI